METRAPQPEARTAPERGRVLVLAPHADDEIIGCGGTLALHVAQGDDVSVIVAFDGAASDPAQRFTREKLREKRRDEARAGGAVLGVSAYEFLDHPEGHHPTPEQFFKAAELLAARLRAFAPRSLYAPWIGEHHLDHHVLARAARLALQSAAIECTAWGYEVWTPLVPTRVIDITGVIDKKREALDKHTSQIAYHDIAHRAVGLNAQRSAYLPPGARYGEAFAPLGSAQPPAPSTAGPGARA